MNDSIAAKLAGYLKQYHTHSHRARMHGLAGGGVNLKIVRELENYRRVVANDYDEIERLVRGQGFTSIIIEGKRRVQEIREEVKDKDDASEYGPEIKELYRQMRAASELLERLNG